jgi:hypothetical protein
MALRWKKHPRETGLRAVGANPNRASDLLDGASEYATVYPFGGTWRGKLQGWYFTSRLGGHVNTCNDLAPDEATAKAQAMAYVKSQLAKQE